MHSHLSRIPALLGAVKKLEQLKPDEFELYFQRRTSTEIDSKDLQVDSLDRAEDLGIAVRLIKNQRLGFSFTTSLERAAVDRAIETAFEVARFMPPDEFLGFHSFGSTVYPDVDARDPRGPGEPMSRKIELAKTLESECRKADSRVKTVRSAGIAEHVTEVHLVDSAGAHIHHESTLYTASVTCKAEAGAESQMGSDFGFSNYLDHLAITKTAQNAARFATELLGAGPAPTMICPAILRNNVVGELIDFISSSFSAEQIDKGRSMLAGKKGERIFSEKVSLIDDGLLAGGYATSPFDSEGIPSTKTALVDGGFLSGALFDVYYARKNGTHATGSAARGIKGPPSISFTNLYLQSGKIPFAGLLEGITRGVLITDLMGVHTANPVTGDFSLGASGILIESGKLTRPVRGFAVAGNVLDVFRRVTDVGSDLKFFGPVGAPSVRISEISVGGV